MKQTLFLIGGFLAFAPYSIAIDSGGHVGFISGIVTGVGIFMQFITLEIYNNSNQ